MNNNAEKKGEKGYLMPLVMIPLGILEAFIGYVFAEKFYLAPSLICSGFLAMIFSIAFWPSTFGTTYDNNEKLSTQLGVNVLFIAITLIVILLLKLAVYLQQTI